MTYINNLNFVFRLGNPQHFKCGFQNSDVTETLPQVGALMRLRNYSCMEKKSPETNLNEVNIEFKNYSCRRTGSGGNR